MEYGTGSNYSELSWADAETEHFPIGLDELIAANEQLEASIHGLPDHMNDESLVLTLPLDREKAFSNFGLMLGIFPPATLFLSILFAIPEHRFPPLQIGVLLLLANATTALTGYQFGKVVSRMIGSLEQQSMAVYVIISVLVGTLWGVVSGGLGGLFLFLFGGIPGAVVGGAVGTIALPAFLVPYNLLRRGQSIGLAHFMPISVGITATICAAIINLFSR